MANPVSPVRTHLEGTCSTSSSSPLLPSWQGGYKEQAMAWVGSISGRHVQGRSADGLTDNLPGKGRLRVGPSPVR